MSGESEFWTEADEKHQKIAKTFYQNIEYKHPETVDSRGMCVCLEWTDYCGWAATSVEYPEYTGPRISNIE
jgi:hypothetical protein